MIITDNLLQPRGPVPDWLALLAAIILVGFIIASIVDACTKQ